MSQIFRAMKMKITQIRRFYGSRRNMRSHYETLRISPDASPGEIRLAFIELSKEMHPDTSKKTNHAEFVKIHEAYKILCKENTRRLYDLELKINKGSHGRPCRVVYYESGANPYNTWNPQYANDPSNNYYGITGIKRVSNLTIAFLCLIGSAIGISVLMIVLSKAVVHQQDQMLAETKKQQEGYERMRAELSGLSRAEEIEAFEKRSAAREKSSSIQFQS